MGLQAPPTKIPIGGLLTSGSPLDRSPDSSVRCRNFRIMPGAAGRGPYLRLRGGRKRRLALTDADRIYSLYEWSGQGFATKCVGRYDSNGGASLWADIDLDGGTFALTPLVSVGAVPTHVFPLGVRDKLFLPTNSYGRGTGTAIKSWDGTTVRNVGLDAYVLGGNPTVSFAAGAGNNTVLTKVDVWVGLYNSYTTHYGNAVYAGRITTTGASGTITVGNLTRLQHQSTNATELAELFYVYYASIDSGETAYLVLNSTLDGPLKTAVGTASQSLSVTVLSTQGFILDFTQERPYTNFPPRVVSAMAYANGRVYANGISGAFSSVQPPKLKGPNGVYYSDFQYLPSKLTSGSVVWSSSAADTSARNFVGVPEESWPVTNRKFTPNGEVPLILASVQGSNHVLVITQSSTFLLTESADGLHTWDTVNDDNGIYPTIGGPTTFVKVGQGHMWLTQNRQLALFDHQTLSFRILSENFDAYLVSGEPLAADYLKDPRNGIDYYEIWFTSGISVVYDFGAGGTAWQKTTSAFVSAAATIRDASGRRHHLYVVFNSGMFSQEADYSTGLIATRDELSPATFTDPTGEYITQWMDFGDHRDRTRFTDLDIVGDGEVSDQLSTAAGGAPTRPLSAAYYVDFDDTEHFMDMKKSTQSQDNQDHNYKDRTNLGNPFWLKLKLTLAGHGADGPSTYTPNATTDAEIPPNFYGCIYEIAPTAVASGNRP